MRRRSSARFSRRSASSALAVSVCLTLAALTGAAQQTGRTPSGSPTKTLREATDHLSLTAALAPVAIAPGSRVVIAVDVKPKAGMHVYAPGSQYRAVVIKLAAGSPFRLAAPLEYPKPVPYHFKPLNETVPVYDAPFRLVAQLELDPSRATVTPLQGRNEMPLNVSFDYQACDDRVCYLPESLPLRWTVTRLPTRRP